MRARFLAIFVGVMLAGAISASPATSAGAAPGPSAGGAPDDPSAADALTVAALAAGDDFVCLLLSDGLVTCLGDNFTYGTAPAGAFTSIAAGWDGACAIRIDGTVACWGANYEADPSVPAGTFTAVSVGRTHACGVRSSGTLECWGGYGETVNPPAGTYTAVNAGWLHSCAIRTDGSVACWGGTYYGETTAPAGTFTAVEAALFYSCGIRTDASLTCWGRDESGVATPPAGTFTAVSGASWHACARRADGTLACWGDDYYGRATPPAGTYTAVGAGGAYSCALTAAGTVACWGGSSGQPPTTVLVSPASVEFGDTYVGSPAATKTVSIRNLGAGNVTVGTVAIEQTGMPDDFSIDVDPCTGAMVAPLATCLITLGFTPTSPGSRSTSLSITGLGYGTRYVGLSGTGLDAITVTPASVDFGSVYVGSTDTPEVVTVSNLGSTPLEITTASIDMASDFRLVGDTCTGTPVAGGGSCTLTIEFTPSAVGQVDVLLWIDGPGAVGTRYVTLVGLGYQSSSGVEWGTRYKAGPAYTWNSGSALGRTVQSDTQRLHLAYATDRVGGSWVRDSGPYMGVYYIRSTSGSTWSTPKRVNPSTQHAERPGLAAAGSRVYVAWVRQTKVIRYSPTAPRVLYIRVNTSHGSSTKWKSSVRLTSTSGRVDYPTIAASGYDVYVAYTDANTGSVKVAASHDRGATWAKTTVGTTTHSTSEGEGKAGWPSVAVSGSVVAVAWLADVTGTVSVATSVDGGVTWGAPESVGLDSMEDFGIAVRGDRIALTWTTADTVVVRLRTGGTWTDAIAVGTLTMDDGLSLYSPTVVLQDPDRIAVTWSEEINWGDYASHLRWVESADGGVHWFKRQTLASAYTAPEMNNDWASVQWPTARTRQVVWNGWTYEDGTYRLYFRKGTGTPVGPATAAATWQPQPDLEVRTSEPQTARWVCPGSPSRGAGQSCAKRGGLGVSNP